jgi:hypothetical protein
MANPFDQFDDVSGGGQNPFDQFDEIQPNPQAAIIERYAPMGPKVVEEATAIINDKSLKGFERLERLQALEKDGGARYKTEGYQSSVPGAIGHGAADTISFGFGDEINAGIDALTGQKPYDQSLEYWRSIQGQSQAENPKSYLAGQVAGAVAPALITGGGSSAPTIGGKIVSGSAVGAGQGAAYGFGSGEGGAGNRAKNAAVNAAAGGVAGAAAPVIGKALGGLLNSGVNAATKIVTPFAISAERKGLLNILENEGVKVTAGQKTGSKALRNIESELGGGKVADLMENQGEQYTQAALRKAGITAPRATPEVVDKAFSEIGRKFDDLALQSDIIPDTKLADDLMAVADDYGAVTPVSQQANLVQKTLMDITDYVNTTGKLEGKAYKTIRSRLAKFSRETTTPELKGALNGIMEALDDAMQRNNPALAKEWKSVRSQYRNMLVIEQAATSAGANAAEGLISPSALRNATVQKQTRRAYARGKGDFADLARAGEAVMKPLPDSGTAARLAARGATSAIPGAIGATIGATRSPESISGGIGGGLIGMAIPVLAGRGLLSGPVQKYLSNQALGKTSRKASQKLEKLLTAMVRSGGLLAAPDVGR